MNETSSLKANAVGWVKTEFDTLIASAEDAVAAYGTGGADCAAALQQSVSDLIQIEKALTLVDLPVGRLLAGELSHALEFLLAHGGDASGALGVIPEALLTLRNFLNHLSLGGDVEAVVFLELLNKLRAARGAARLTEREVFFPVFHAVSAPAVQTDRDSRALIDARVVAAKARPYYEAGLIAWFRGGDEGGGLKKMLAVTARLHITARYESSRRLWWIGSALLEALLLGTVEPDAEMKGLFGRLDREIKRLIECGEQQFDAGIPDDLIRGLLYFLAIAEDAGRYVRDVKAAFALERVLPEKALRDEQRMSIDGRSSELQISVAKGVREELQQVRDSLEVRLSADTQRWTAPCPEAERLRQASETLSMIGAQGLSRQIDETADLLHRWSEQGAPFVDDALTDVAADILGVELELEGASADHVFDRRTPVGAEATSSEALRTPGADLMASVANLLLEETEALKDAITRHISTPEDQDWASELPEVVARILGALDVLGASPFRVITAAIGEYLAARPQEDTSGPDSDEIQALAEVVTSIQCYAEVLKGEGATDLSRILRAGQESARRLASRGRFAPTGASEYGEPSDQEGADSSPEAARPGDAPEGEEAPVCDARGSGADGPDERVLPETASGLEDRATQVPDRFRELQVLGAQPDPDILEVFLEEASEETHNIGAALDTWKRTMTDSESLGVMRRSFHTLKGSGRLVGAELLGEFGWIFEDLLNRLIEGAVTPRPIHVELVSDAVEWLPRLTQGLESRDAPPAEVYLLMMAAAATAGGDDGPAAVWQKKKPLAPIQ